MIKQTLSRKADFFFKHFLGRKTQKVFLKNSNMFRMTFPVIDSNLTGIRLEASEGEEQSVTRESSISATTDAGSSDSRSDDCFR